MRHVNFCSWYEPADPECPLMCRYRVISGQLMLNASFWHIDPTAWLPTHCWQMGMLNPEKCPTP